MTGFGLDDVRESFTADATRYLAQVETRATSLALSALAIPDEPSWREPLDAVAIGLHGIAGSSSLIALDSLTVPAHRLADVAGSAAESIRMIRHHAVRLANLASLCRDGASELRMIVEHELAGRTGDAEQQSSALVARVDDAVRALDSGPAPIASAASTAALDDELVAAFRDEARETLSHLQGYAARLDGDLDDDEAAALCTRLLHRFTGAAAVVGQAALAARADELHAWLERVRRQGVTRGAVAELGRGIDELMARALGERPGGRVAAHTVAAAARYSALDDDDLDAGSDEPREILFDEARRAIGELTALARQIRAAEPAARAAAASHAERAFHRLKGSAMIVGERQLAQLALRGQRVCEPLAGVDPAALDDAIRDLASGLGEARSLAREAGGGPMVHKLARPHGEEWDAYLEESSALLDDLDHRLAALEQTARPAVELSTMFRMYHTLKGASSSVGLAPLAHQLHLIEAFVEQLAAAPVLPELRTVVAALASEHAALRSNIALVSSRGIVEVDHTRTSARLAAAGAAASAAVTSWISANDPVWTSGWDPRGELADPTQASQDSHASQAPPATEVLHGSQGPHGSQPRALSQPAPAGEPAIPGDGAGVAEPPRLFVRVAADRLDSLLDLVGELVVARSRILSRIAGITHLQDTDHQRHTEVVRVIDDFVARLALDHDEELRSLARQLDEGARDLQEMRRGLAAELQQLTDDSEALSAIVSDLQSQITRARMVTIEALFARLQLAIRDAAHRLGREVEIVMRGEDVAIDKAISDALFGPLLHLVRNAVGHGIEPPARRQELGKPRAGALTLAARQDDDRVVLELSDDGQGVDTARLKATGVARGLVDAAIADDDPRVLELVFAHGVTTSDEAGDVAGRGVGGNVARRAVDRLGGAIEIATARGLGTTFRIALPLSMSITQALVVRSAGAMLAIPIAFVEAILPNDAAHAGRAMPVHHTQQLFGAASAPGGVLAVCAVGGERIAIHVDEVVGQEDIVVKSLGSLLDGHPLFSGATQRSDGELVLIVDVSGLVADQTAEPASDAREPVHPIAVTEIAPLPSGVVRVLFVDDSLSVRKAAERMLVELGAEVVTAVDGRDALDKLRTTAFSLVVTDLEMPRMHGYELLREMQYLPAYRAIPVVVISSRSGPKHVERALGLGAREVLTKPFSPEVFQAVLRHVQ